MYILKGKVAIVTGAAGGIAHAIVLQLASAGVHLALLDSDEQRLSQLARCVREQFDVQISFFCSDLSSEWGVKFGVSSVLKPFNGRIDVLVANVGQLIQGPFATLSSDQWHQSFAINFFSHVWIVQSILPVLQQQNQGRILFIGSDQARQPESGLSAYASAKAALHSLTKTLARELAPGILVSGLAPGMTRTPLVETLLRGYAQEFGTDTTEAERREIARRDIPLGRLGEPEEVAQAALFLLQNDFTTGTILDVSGGNVRGL